MKSKRHAKILELIAEFEIDTQEDLLGRLNENGFKVTQATVSRDIKELRLIKVQSAATGTPPTAPGFMTLLPACHDG